MQIYFVRHGESEANLKNVFSNRGTQHGLTTKGIVQSRELATSLEKVPIRRIYSSPLLRAVQTAQILVEKGRCPIQIMDALREYDCGILEGQSDPASWEIYYQVFDQWIQGQWNAQIEGGESFNDIRARFIPFIDSVLKKYQNSPHNIIMVGHGGLYKCMLPLVVEDLEFDDLVNKPLTNTGYILVESIQGRLQSIKPI